MKNIPLATILALTACTAIIPEVAQADEIVTFEYLPSELHNVDARQGLLLRLKSRVQKACATGSIKPYANLAECQKDVETQLLAAIDSPVFSSLLQMDNVKLANARH